MAEGTWEADFCGCTNVPVACCLILHGGWLGLACVQCENKKEMDGDGGHIACLLACCLCCIGAAMNRGKVREKYSLGGSCFIDCILYMCCDVCMGTQEYREVLLQKDKAGHK